MSYDVPCPTCGHLGGYCSCDEVFISIVEFAKPVEILEDITEQLTMEETCKKRKDQIADGFMQHTTIEIGTVINITDGPYKGVWEAVQGGWRKI